MALSPAIIHAIPAFRDNYIWWLQGNDQQVVVDPGDAAPVIDALESQNAQLDAILITHHHPDHTGGIKALQARYPDVTVWGPDNPSIPGITHALKDGDLINLAGMTFAVLAVPGHTLDHIAFYAQPDDAEPILFCGDTLFSSGCGRLFEGTPEQMFQSLQRLAALPDTTRVYCTHEYTLANLAFAQAVEPDNSDVQARLDEVQRYRASEQPSLPSTLSLEKRVNPFLRCNLAAVQAGVSSQSQVTSTPQQVFTALRAWKDSF